MKIRDSAMQKVGGKRHSAHRTVANLVMFHLKNNDMISLESANIMMGWTQKSKMIKLYTSDFSEIMLEGFEFNDIDFFMPFIRKDSDLLIEEFLKM